MKLILVYLPRLNVQSINYEIVGPKELSSFIVEISGYNIVVNEDIFVSMEWIENLTHKDLYFSTSPGGSTT